MFILTYTHTHMTGQMRRKNLSGSQEKNSTEIFQEEIQIMELSSTGISTAMFNVFRIFFFKGNVGQELKT